jgi:ketosteroid isomerase-like protein
MHTKKAIVGLAFAFAACSLVGRAAADERKDVEQATKRFYESLNTLFTGDASDMKEIWSHADDVTYMGPAGGFQVGWEQVSAIWDHQAALKLDGQVEPFDTQLIVSGDLAVTQCIERGNNVDAWGTLLPVSIRATTIFRKENDAWKVIGHHTDLLPALQKQALTGQRVRRPVVDRLLRAGEDEYRPESF